MVLLVNLAPAFVHEDANATLADAFLVGEGNFGEAHAVGGRALVRVLVVLNHHRLLSELAVLEHLLLDHVLPQHLVVELKRLLVDQLVVQPLAVRRLHDVALGVDTVLVALVSRGLVLALELLLLLDRVAVVLDEAARRRGLELVDASVIQLINCLVEGIPVNVVSLPFELGVESRELVLDCLRLDLELLVVEPVLGLAVDAELFDV